MLNVMATQPSGALCESSVIQFLVPCRKVWLTSAARFPCSNAANIGERKTWTQSEFCSWQNSVRRTRAPKNVYIMYQPKKRPNILQSFVDLRERRWCSNEAKTRNRLKFDLLMEVPQTRQQISDVSGPAEVHYIVKTCGEDTAV